ncbi:MAG: N-formylglutamate amidohydrolase [archaeon]|nr:N-formylglutamate amidohydrolase [archaeon]
MEILITIPHGSVVIPEEFNHEFILAPEHMNLHLDYGTEKIFELENFDVLKATVSRFVVDLNREREDLQEGQGVIITETWSGEKVLKHKLTPKTIENRLVKYYDSFYKKLDSYLIEKKKPLFVLDGHSMDSKGSLVSGDAGKERPEICFATGRGSGTVPENLLNIFEEEFQNAGYHAERNNPYSGARAKIIHYTTQKPNIHALELEVNKAVYMNEKTFELKKEPIKKFRNTLTNVLNKIKNL